ncbi:MAG TPA: SPOR domain-containing protein [Candidatus Binatia bacterium]
MAENRRGKENRFYFSRGQLVLLGAAFTLGSVLIFLLGIFVGQSIEERKLLKKNEPLVKIPVKPGAQESSSKPAPSPPKDEITFDESGEKSANTAVAAEEKPKNVKPSERIAAAEVKEKVALAKADAPPAKATEKKAEKAAPVVNTTKKIEAVMAEPKASGKPWRAQVNAFPDERSAQQIVDRLKIKGYNAYVTEVQNKGKTWFRVNVGKYSSRDEADKMVDVLRSKENYPKAFAATK